MHTEARVKIVLTGACRRWWAELSTQGMRWCLMQRGAESGSWVELTHRGQAGPEGRVGSQWQHLLSSRSLVSQVVGVVLPALPPLTGLWWGARWILRWSLGRMCPRISVGRTGSVGSPWEWPPVRREVLQELRKGLRLVVVVASPFYGIRTFKRVRADSGGSFSHKGGTVGAVASWRIWARVLIII